MISFHTEGILETSLKLFDTVQPLAPQCLRAAYLLRDHGANKLEEN